MVRKARPRSRSTASKREALLRALQEAGRPLTAYEILDRIRTCSVNAPTTVYRLLEQLIGEGLVHRLESINAFVACNKGGCQDRHEAAFSICDECGRTREFSDSQIFSRLRQQAQALGFELQSTTLEIRGRCSSCAGKA